MTCDIGGISHNSVIYTPPSEPELVNPENVQAIVLLENTQIGPLPTPFNLLDSVVEISLNKNPFDLNIVDIFLPKLPFNLPVMKTLNLNSFRFILQSLIIPKGGALILQHLLTSKSYSHLNSIT
jgi:hypothetical protein